MNLPIQSKPVYRYGMSGVFAIDEINPSACGGYKTCITMTCNSQTCTALGHTLPNPFNGATGTGQCCGKIATKKGCCCLSTQQVCH